MNGSTNRPQGRFFLAGSLVRSHAGALRQHPDLQDFDDYAERWYG